MSTEEKGNPMALIVTCSFKRCRFRIPVHKAIEHDGKHFCRQECLNLHIASAGEEVKRPTLAEEFWGYDAPRIGRQFSDEDTP